jgi:hypothetical protein
MAEKRKFMRFNVLMDALCKRGTSNKKLKVNNFSREGLGILSTEALNTGDDVELVVNIPGDNMPVMVKGEVAWTLGPSPDNRQHKSGVRFKNINNADRSRILGYIYQKWIMPANIA